MKVSELTGAQLDYWVARAEGVPAERLEIRRVPRTDWLHVVRTVPVSELGYPGLRQVAAEVMRYSSDWVQGGPLIDSHRVSTTHSTAAWFAGIGGRFLGSGDTPLLAICRAVVRAAFGDEVDEAPVQPA